MKVIGICRFSLIGRGDWKAWREGEDEAALLRDQAAMLFAPARMEARLASFAHLTLKSLAAQTDPDFTFIVLASTQMPDPWRARLIALCAQVPQVELRFFGPITASAAQAQVFRTLGVDPAEVLQFRLDDDDAVAVDYIAWLKRATAKKWAETPIFAASFRGVMYVVRNGPTAGIYHWPVDFFSAGAALRHPSKSIYDFGHFALKDRFPNVIIEGRLALVTNNGLNDTSMSPAMLKRRKLTRMPPEAIAAAVATNFPFLDIAGRYAAGLLRTRAEVLAEIGLPALEAEVTDPPAAWITDFEQTPQRRGFFVKDVDFALQHTLRDEARLYVSFDNLSGPRAATRLRDPWGYAFAESRGWSCLGVLAYQEHWFRSPRLFEELKRLRDQGFFARFGQVILSGTSMGGYAACAFSSLVPGSTVIAFSPQSTLRDDLAPFDTRYRNGIRADWSGPFSDAAAELPAAGRAWIVFDPHVPEDRIHAERMAGPNVGLLRARHSGHFTAQFLRQLGLLSGIVSDAVAGRMSEAAFYARYRQARTYRRYLGSLAQHAQGHWRAERQLLLADALQVRGVPQIANQLRRAGGTEAAPPAGD